MRPIVFGAFDRHNFGDMLFAHIVAGLLAQKARGIEPMFAGCAQRDLRALGGHDLAAISSMAQRLRNEPVTLIHAGGELLTCDAWEAAVMLTTPEDAQARIARFGRCRPRGPRELARDDWMHAQLGGRHAKAPYVVGRETFPRAASICFNAIGGAALDARNGAFREEVLTKLRTADRISVRDTVTQAALERAGIRAALVPDAASLVAERFAARPVSPCGYLAVQFSADFGDDATLARVAEQLDRLGASTGLGIALFRAGAAPWHDDLAVYARMAARMRRASVRLADSLNVADICALIAGSEGFAGSSLHGRIVAMAYGLPRINFAWDEAPKQRAYISTWEIADAPGVVAIDEIRAAMLDAMSLNRETLREHARALADAHRAGFEALYG